MELLERELEPDSERYGTFVKLTDECEPKERLSDVNTQSKEKVGVGCIETYANHIHEKPADKLMATYLQGVIYINVQNRNLHQPE